jgi:UV DNA damage repair endonuclease
MDIQSDIDSFRELFPSNTWGGKPVGYQKLYYDDGEKVYEITTMDNFLRSDYVIDYCIAHNTWHAKMIVAIKHKKPLIFLSDNYLANPMSKERLQQRLKRIEEQRHQLIEALKLYKK